MYSSFLRKKFNQSLFEIYSSEELNIIYYNIMQELTNKSKVELMTNNYELSHVKEKLFFEYINRLSNNEPLQYVLGNTIFNKLEFDLNSSVLIPRPETEELVDLIIKYECKKEKILDIGSGSGCIAVTLAKYIEKSNVTALEICSNAVKIIHKNAKKHNVKMNIICEDFLTFNTNSTFDLIVSNPPYIVKREVKRLSNDIKKFEPIVALDGGNDGLDVIKKVIYKSKYILKSDGILALEIGTGQYSSVMKLLKVNNFRKKILVRDYRNNIRCIFSTL